MRCLYINTPTLLNTPTPTPYCFQASNINTRSNIHDFGSKADLHLFILVNVRTMVSYIFYRPVIISLDYNRNRTCPELLKRDVK